MNQVKAVVLTDIRPFIFFEDFPQEIDVPVDLFASAILREESPRHLHHSVGLLLGIVLGVALHGRELIDQWSESFLPLCDKFL